MLEFTTIPRSARIRNRGQLTIPQDIREALELDEHTSLNIFRVGKVLIMTPRRLQRASLAKAAEKEMERKGLTLQDLLADLQEQRKRFIEANSTKD